jgi:hypothetical protein
MARIDLSTLAPSVQADVERRLAIRYRLDDGSRPSETLREMIHAERFVAKTHRQGPRSKTYGLLMVWPQRDEPYFLQVPRSLWAVVDLPVQSSEDKATR